LISLHASGSWLGQRLTWSARPGRADGRTQHNQHVRGRRPSWLSGNLLLLTAISLLQDTASEMVYPLLPLLLTGILAAPPVVLGVIEGLADATAGLTRYFAGRWSDTAGRKPFIGFGYSLAALGKVLVAAASTWTMVLGGRVVDRFGKGMRSAPRDALIADSVPPSALGRAFGFHRAGDSLGAVIGPLLGLVILAALDGDIRAALWWAVIPAALSAILVIFVRERPAGSASRPVTEAPTVSPPTAGVPEVEPVRRRLRRPGKSPLPKGFWLVTAMLVAISLINFSDALLLLRLVDLGFSATEVVLAYVLFNLVYTAAAYPAGVLTDRWPRPYVYAAGLVAFAIGYAGLGLVDGGAAAVVLIAIYGLFPAFTDGVAKAWVSSLVPDQLRGRAQGVYQMLTSAAVLLAGLWAGLLWTSGAGSGTLPLLVAGIAAGVAAMAMIVLRLVIRQR